MFEIDPTTLPGTPAPFWFAELFKGIGFFLHLIPMHVWFAGLPLAILSLVFGGPLANRFSRRMFGQMPIFLAIGVNFAIVPLLFLQTTYYKAFYTATILIAWHWLVIIPLFLVAYYMIYIASFSMQAFAADAESLSSPLKSQGEKQKNAEKRKDNKPQQAGEESGETKKPKVRGRMRTAFLGGVAWICLVLIGVLIAHAMNLMGRSDVWLAIWEKTNISGAVSGMGNYFRDPVLWIKFAGMFGLALLTAAFWAVFDSHFLIRKSENESTNEKNAAYRKWSIVFGSRISWLGWIITVCSYTYYFWLLDQSKTVDYLFKYPYFILPIALLVLPIIQVAILTRGSQVGKVGGFFMSLLILSETAILGTFVTARQLIQNAEVGRFVQIEKIPEAVQWDSLYTFLGVFAFGLLVVLWIIRQIAVCPTDRNTQVG